ncbi:MAG TPA: hypothetical protein VFX76_21190, partial [Roseiflexaceae bacterium]|nr:hypothetical protein [Roseiflexaceae bacterium]
IQQIALIDAAGARRCRWFNCEAYAGECVRRFTTAWAWLRFSFTHRHGIPAERLALRIVDQQLDA